MAQLGGSRGRKRSGAPRVQITYDVESAGATRRKELPFVFGVLGDFAGQPETPPQKLRERQFVEVTKESFNAAMKSLQPRLTFRVDNKLGADGSMLVVTLRFQSVDDFEPEPIAQQVEPLRALIAVRQQLSALRATLRRQPQLGERLHAVLGVGSRSPAVVGDNSRETPPAGSRHDGAPR